MRKGIVSVLISAFAMFAPSMAADQATVDGLVYQKDGDAAELVRYNRSFATADLVIPETVEIAGTQCMVTKIADGAFRDCLQLASLSIPGTVTSIGNEAFNGCTGIVSLRLEKAEPADLPLVLGYSEATVTNIAFGYGLFHGLNVKDLYIGRKLSLGGNDSDVFPDTFGSNLEEIVIDYGGFCNVRDCSKFNYLYNRTMFQSARGVKRLVINTSRTDADAYAPSGEGFLLLENLEYLHLGEGYAGYSADHPFPVLPEMPALATLELSGSTEGLSSMCLVYVDNVIVNDGVTEIAPQSLRYSTKLVDLRLPASVVKVGGMSLPSSLRELWCYAVTPPQAVADIFADEAAYGSCRLIVPEESVDMYADDSFGVWYKFDGGIVSGVDAVAADASLVGEPVYAVDGRRVATVVDPVNPTASLPAGVYIIGGRKYVVTHSR